MSINAQPFNPTFKLIGNLEADQVLTYDVSENAFVNSTGSGGTSVTGFTTAVSQGSVGESIFDTAGSTLQFKSLIGGTDITITDNGTALVINSTLTETLQTGTNLGTGTALYTTNNASNELQFKSLAVGAGLTLTDDGAGTLTLVNTVAGGGVAGADTTLSNLSDVATARTNLGVSSTAQADVKYLRTDASTIPQLHNTYDIGSPSSKYNDVYAETFHGTAILADNLTTPGTTGQVLTYNGSTWAAADTGGATLSGQSDVSSVAAADGQHLVWNAGTSLWTPSAASSGGGGGGYSDADARASVSSGTGLSYNSATGVMTLNSSISGLTDVDTTGIASGQVLKWNGTSFVASADTDTNTDTTYTAGSGLSLTGTEFANTSPDQTVALTGGGATTITGTYPNFTITSTDTDTDTINSFDGAYASLTGSPSIPTDVNQLADSTNLLTHTTPFSGVYTDLTSKPTTIAGYGITDAFDSSNAFPYANLTGTPTLPTAVSDLTNDSGFISSVPAQTFASLTSTPTTLAGYGITDASTVDTNTTYTAGTGLTLTGTEFTLTVGHFDGAYASLSGKPTIATDVSQLTDTSSLLAHTTAYTNSDADAHLNTSTATANQVLTWTGTDYDWISSGAHFDGNYSSLVGAPTLPTLVSHLTNDSGFITSVPAQTFASLTSKPTTLAGYGITDDADTTYTAGANISISLGNVISSTDTNTDTDTTYSAGTGLTLTGTEFALTSPHFDGAFASLSGVATVTASDDDKVLYYDHATTSFKWKAGGTPTGYNNTNWDTAFGWGNHATAGYLTSTTAHYTDSDVDTHLNTSTATANQVLTWTGTDYDWISSGAHFDGNYSSLVGAPTTLSSFTNDAGFLTSETDSQTLTLTGTTLAITGGNSVTLPATISTIDDLADVTINTVSDGQFLKYNNVSGDWENETISLFDGAYSSLSGKPTIATDVSQLTDTSSLLPHTAAYTDTDARTAISSSTGLSYNNATGVLTLNATLGNLLDVSTTSPNSGEVLKWNGTTWAPAIDLVLTSTDQLAQGSTNEYYTSAKVDAVISGKTTDDLSEGTNKYFTDARARASISATGDLTYNSATGVISFTQNDAWSNITGTPTTLAGYGITDATDTDTTYTAGSGLTLTGTEFTLTASHFDGAYSSLSGKPTLPTAVSDLTNDSGFITSVPAQTFTSLTGKPTTLAGYGITDAIDTDTTYTAGTNVSISAGNVISTTDTNTDTTYTAGSGLTLTGTEFTLTAAHFDGAYASLTGAPTMYANSNVDGHLNTSTATSSQILSWTGTDYDWITNAGTPAWSSITSKPTTIAGFGITDSFSGSYTDLTSKPTIPSALTDLSISDGTTGQVLTTNGSGAFTFTTVSGGSVTDKIEEGNSSVEVIDGGADGRIMFNTNGTDRWTVDSGGHILPETNSTYDIGSASKKVRHLFLSGNSLHLDTNTVKTSGTNLLFNDADVMDYDNLKNKPSIPEQNTAGTGIQLNSGVVSINASLDLLSNVSSTAPASGEVLKWNGTTWAPATDLTSGSSAMNDLTDVDTTGLITGQYLQWNGTAFVASTVSGGGASAINDLSDVDTVTSAPSNGDVLTWSTTDSEWAPTAPTGGGSGATVEMFKLNYATNGNLTSITNTTSGVSATITSATGGTVEISFSGTNYPPASILMYGYAYATNKYAIKTASGDIDVKEVAGGGSSGSPIAFGSMGSVNLTLKLREADTGASRSFGTTTHAWVMFTVV